MASYERHRSGSCSAAALACAPGDPYDFIVKFQFLGCMHRRPFLAAQQRSRQRQPSANTGCSSRSCRRTFPGCAVLAQKGDYRLSAGLQLQLCDALLRHAASRRRKFPFSAANEGLPRDCRAVPTAFQTGVSVGSWAAISSRAARPRPRTTPRLRRARSCRGPDTTPATVRRSVR